MEKIKHALERAKLNKHSASLQNLKKVTNSNVPIDLTDIRYTKTKQLDVSKKDLKKNRIICDDQNDLVSNQYKLLRTHVLQAMKLNKWNSIAITSPSEGNGKTLTSINLAINLAKEVNHSVLLVDMDLKRPTIAKYFSSNNTAGLNEYLTSEVSLEDILFTPKIERLVVLPGSRIIENSSEMLSSPKMVMLVNELKSRYPNRIVIYDMPPILSCDDMLVFSNYVDAVMLVVEDEVTQKEDLKNSYQLLKNSNIIGTVLNKSNQISSQNIY